MIELRFFRHGRALLSACCLLVTIMVGVQAGAAPSPPVVVELFTSQGCSSCPAAEAFLGELAARGDVLALAYHVDYWDYIGWRDPFATRETTQRQRDYARMLNQKYVYTPEMVVNGVAHGTGSDREAITDLIARQAEEASEGPAVRIGDAPGGGLAIHIGPTVDPRAFGGRPATIWFILFDREHRTSVALGENGGKTLVEHQIVRSIRPVGTWRGSPTEILLDAEEGQFTEGGCAVLLQRDGTGPIIAAAIREQSGRHSGGID
jgi:hypothetical protein